MAKGLLSKLVESIAKPFVKAGLVTALSASLALGMSGCKGGNSGGSKSNFTEEEIMQFRKSIEKNYDGTYEVYYVGLRSFPPISKEYDIVYRSYDDIEEGVIEWEEKGDSSEKAATFINPYRHLGRYSDSEDKHAAKVHYTFNPTNGIREVCIVPIKQEGRNYSVGIFADEEYIKNSGRITLYVVSGEDSERFCIDPWEPINRIPGETQDLKWQELKEGLYVSKVKIPLAYCKFPEIGEEAIVLKTKYENVVFIKIGRSWNAFLEDSASIPLQVNNLTDLKESWDFDKITTWEGNIDDKPDKEILAIGEKANDKYDRIEMVVIKKEGDEFKIVSNRKANGDYSVQIHDYNGDGRKDFVVTNQFREYNYNWIFYYDGEDFRYKAENLNVSQ